MSGLLIAGFIVAALSALGYAALRWGVDSRPGVDDGLKPAGLFSAADGEVVMRGDATEAIGAGVTEEPAGGSPAPTTKPIAFIDFRAKS